MNVDIGDTYPLWSLRPCHSCDRDCRHFQLLNEDGWSEWGICASVKSPWHSFPVLVGRECLLFQGSPENG